ncbi:MAG: GrpB family protein [Deltaproteobacteria bacterium]|nr:GrpB family protein [Deltaproteobacteria bacterium]
MEKIIGPYKKPQATFNPYDHRAPEVAKYLKKQIELCVPRVTIEHIGSTAIPSCSGKGVVDLMALYPKESLDVVKSLLSAMGFQRQGKEFRNRFPDTRPVMMGTFEYDNTSFLIYVHVIHEDSYEAIRFRIFRDRLCNDSELLSAYIAEKKRIISEGVTDTDNYAEMKQSIIQRILGDDYDEKSHSES